MTITSVIDAIAPNVLDDMFADWLVDLMYEVDAKPRNKAEAKAAFREHVLAALDVAIERDLEIGTRKPDQIDVLFSRF